MTPTRPLGATEFIVLMAMTSATVAFSIDAMLPALPRIADELTPDAVNRAQLIITSFVLGIGLGTFFTGPLSDRFGRRPVMIGGALLYIVAAVGAWAAQTLEWMLAARLLMGLGASGPRVVALAMIRDRYAGTEMARIMSFVMVVFTTVPALAPTIGALVIGPFGWRAVFVLFVLFVGTVTLWLYLRQPETLPPARRRPLNLGAQIAGAREMFANQTARLSIIIQTLSFGLLFGVLSSTQQIFDETYGYGATFHFWFGGIAVFAASASLVNARFVGRIGMRGMIRFAFLIQIALSASMAAAVILPLPIGVEFAVYVVWTTAAFFQAGLSIGNLNALGMEQMGHIAGMAASIMTAFSTVGAVLIAVPVGLAYDGTPLPVAVAALVCACTALWLTLRLRRPGDLAGDMKVAS